MNVMKFLGTPVLALYEQVEVVLRAGSVANARQAAEDSALRSRAYDALREAVDEPDLRFGVPA